MMPLSRLQLAVPKRNFMNEDIYEYISKGNNAYFGKNHVYVANLASYIFKVYGMYSTNVNIYG